MAVQSTKGIRNFLQNFLIAFSLSAVLLIASAYAQTSQYILTNTLCGIITAISQIVGVLAIFMFILGGTLYAFAHLLPAAGNIKGAAQGWGMSVLMGGIIMIILYGLAPFIVNTVIQFSTGSASSGLGIGSIGYVSCPLGGSGSSGGSGIIPGTSPGTCSVSACAA